VSDAAARHIRRSLPPVRALRPGDPVPSPCNNVCRIDPASGFCEGCLRTIEEVAAWGSMGDEERRDVWRMLENRANR
jgi:predicted Fe-S protein YdhL (DUF1289 family)